MPAHGQAADRRAGPPRVIALAGCARGETGEPSTVTGTIANLAGRVASDTGGTVEYWVQYGPTTAYGSQTARDTIEVQAKTAGFVFPVLRGL